MSEALITKVAEAIADADVGYSISLTRLVDGISEYTLTYGDGSDPLTFEDNADAYEHVRARLYRAKAEAAIALMNSFDEKLKATAIRALDAAKGKDAELVARLRRLVDNQTDGDALVLVERTLFNKVVGRLSALSAALSVQPAAAVVGEPVGYVSAPELVHLKMGVSCVYAAPSATEGHAVVEPVAFHVKVKGYGEELCFTEDGANSLVQRIRRTKGQHGVATITPLYATLPNEALERSEQATFDIAARLLKERDALASCISQQDAELERLREALKPFALAATIFEQEYGDRMKSDTGCNIKFAVLCQARDALRAKAEGENHG